MTQDKKTTLGINYNTFRRSIKKKKNPLLNKKEEKKRSKLGAMGGLLMMQ